MNKEEIGIEIHNKEELLRCYEHDVEVAKNDKEKAKWNNCVTSCKADISSLQSQQNA
ncbi:MAG: hypothetical protein Q4F66_10315 [Clostridium sp.]|nr:hypothetical protein [Clostridium sp.]